MCINSKFARYSGRDGRRNIFIWHLYYFSFRVPHAMERYGEVRIQFCKRHLSLFRARVGELFRHTSYEVKLMSAPERTEEQTAKHNFQRDRAWYNIPRRISSCTLPCVIPGEYKRRSQINDQDFPSQRKHSTTHFLVCQVQVSRTPSLPKCTWK